MMALILSTDIDEFMADEISLRLESSATAFRRRSSSLSAGTAIISYFPSKSLYPSGKINIHFYKITITFNLQDCIFFIAQ